MIFSPSLYAVFGQSSLNISEMIHLICASGYKKFEFWKWWEEDLDSILSVMYETGIETASVCTKFISLTDPACRNDYIKGLKESITAAKKLKCSHLISQTGNFQQGIAREIQMESLVDGLQAAAPYLEEEGITLVVEPLNTLINHPGYFLETGKEAFSMIDSVGSMNVKVLYDVYHQQVTEGNLILNIVSNLDKMSYVM